MKNTLSFLLICGVAILGICAFCSLPKDTSGIVKEKYSSTSGVIRVWVCDGTNTDPAAWLNTCSTDFEKNNSGIYINIRRVSPSAITSFRETGVSHPDIIIWPAGLLESADGLSEITGEYSLRKGLEASPYAVPLVTDAYAWIHSLSALPADMHDTAVACSEDMLLPMTALSTGRHAGETTGIIIPGVDLGLSGNTEMPDIPQGDTICRASSALVITKDTADALKSCDVSAIAGDISMIRSLCAQGFSAQVTGNIACTGAPIMFSITEAAGERRGTCEDFLTYLMGEEQKKTHLANAMPAAEGVSAHTGDPVLSYIEAQLSHLECISTPIFGGAQVNAKIYRFLSGEITADEALGR